MLKVLSFILFITIGFNTSFAQDQQADIEELAKKYTKEQLLSPIDGDIIIGKEDAPITVIEYASMSCSHCASFHNNTFDSFKEKHIDTGEVKFIFRDYPLDEPALRASMMARCAARENEENFLKFNKAIFSTQSNWAPKKNYLEILSNIGKLGGMKRKDFELCIADKDLERYILENRFFASKILEINSTPTFFINGEAHKGAKNLAYLTGIINKILGKSPESAE